MKSRAYATQFSQLFTGCSFIWIPWVQNIVLGTFNYYQKDMHFVMGGFLYGIQIGGITISWRPVKVNLNYYCTIYLSSLIYHCTSVAPRDYIIVLSANYQIFCFIASKLTALCTWSLEIMVISVFCVKVNEALHSPLILLKLTGREWEKGCEGPVP